jgi:DNA/RNA-binding domain of Phe-tRNA-synthetase-like protein
MSEPAPISQGAVEPELLDEFPELRVLSCEVTAPPRGRDRGAGRKERLALLATRMRGARAVELRREPVPAAYRVFFRHLGIDPDLTRTPIEESAMRRLVTGGHRSRGALADALLLALLDTGVPVSAFDAAALTGTPGLRAARAGESLASRAGPVPLPPGRLVLADSLRALEPLFGEPAEDAAPTRRTERLRLVAVKIPGVPSIHAEEALWTCEEALAAG